MGRTINRTFAGIAAIIRATSFMTQRETGRTPRYITYSTTNLMKLPLLLLVLLSACNPAEKTPPPTPPKPVESITPTNLNTTNDSLFKAMVEKTIVLKPEEKKFIADLDHLKVLALVSCDSSGIQYRDTINGSLIELTLRVQAFLPKRHKIKYRVSADKTFTDCDLIDGKAPWGGNYGCPETEIKSLACRFNKVSIDLGDHFKDLYNLKMGNGYLKRFSPCPLFTYDPANDVFYLYIIGGKAADTYFAKFVIDRKKVLNRYVLSYEQLSETGSFRPEFKGF